MGILEPRFGELFIALHESGNYHESLGFSLKLASNFEPLEFLIWAVPAEQTCHVAQLILQNVRLEDQSNDAPPALVITLKTVNREVLDISCGT